MKLKYFLVILFTVLSTSSFAQDKSGEDDETYYTFYGRIFLENAKGNGVTVKLYDDNTLISTYKTDKKAKFTIGAPSAKHYTVVFEKEGFVPKKVIINTKKVYQSKGNVEDFDFNVYLIKEEVDIDYSILDFPIALIEYKKSIKGFDYNKKYTRQMHKLQNKVIADGFASLLALY